MIELNKIYCGNTLDILKTFPDNFIQCCVTSPPYYGLRDYGIQNQIGLEDTSQEYVKNLVNIFREVKRVLKTDGTFWLNLGDSYASNHITGMNDDKSGWKHGKISKGYMGRAGGAINGIKVKDLIGIPWMVAFALRSDGWYLRSDIIWSKNNPMPESVKDRPTKSHEYIFLLSKNNKYFYDYKAIKEPNSNPNRVNYQSGNRSFGINLDRNDNDLGMRSKDFKPDGRNARSVWNINTKPYRDAHFATFPIELPERCIRAGSKEQDIVLDPFSGAGTTCLVAKNLNRQYIGIDLNPKYCEIAENRIR